ncbi:hypothetical protein D1007_06030 [Hordeum vulgare]|nr:hypothetical protein D1007_06030 [Hordeum vulgare]
MLLGVPLDFRNTNDLRAAVNTFGEFHHRVSDDPYLVRSIVFASFLEDNLVPRSVTFSEYAAWGGAKVSWSAPVDILGANFGEQMPNGKDPMPLNGNPHPLLGQLINDNLLFALPPYPAFGWNAVPPPPPEPEPQALVDGGWGWEPEAAEPEPQPDAPVQDQESMVIDQPTSSDSVQELVVLDPQPAAADDAVVDMPIVQPAADKAAAPEAAPHNDAAAAAADIVVNEEPVEADHAEEAPLFNPLAIVPYNRSVMQQ